MLAIYDVVQGPGGEPSFPVPWASHAGLSHLVTPEELRRLLKAAGFVIESWHDTSEAGRRSIEAQDRRLRASEAPPLVLSVLFGAEALPVSRNLQRNLSEGRVGLLEVTARADQR
jgi:MPBQ/MSBQ methyltransferase